MNSLYNQLNQNQVNQQIPNNIQSVLTMIKQGQNPIQLVNQLAGNNPQFAQLLQTMNMKGITPKQMFYQVANQKGVNPDSILQMFK